MDASDTKKKIKVNKPLSEEQKAKARERWAQNKERYRANTTNANRIQPPLKPTELPPLPKKNKQRANFLDSWPIPSDLHAVFDGDAEIKLPSDQSTWPMFHVRRQSELSEVTKNNYRLYYSRIPRSDVWTALRFINTQALSTRAQFYKAALSYVSEELYNSLYVNKDHAGPASKEYKDNLLKMLVYSYLNKKVKKQVFENHISQACTQMRHENTVDWEEWEMVARRFIRGMLTKKEPSDKDKVDALLAAVYTYIPPVRLDWQTVEVRVSLGGKTFQAQKGEEGKNILYLSAAKQDPQATVFWGDFKNKESFELPLKQSLPRELAKVFAWAKPADAKVGSRYPMFEIPHFSSYLSSLTEQLTGKHFTNRFMRSSYIRWWHKNNSSDGKMDVNKTKEMMKLLHQTDLECHLAYVKNKTLPDEDDT